MFIVRLLLFVPILVIALVGVTLAMVIWMFVGKQAHPMTLPLEDIFSWLMGVGE